jgi:spore coat protein U-like protein
VGAVTSTVRARPVSATWDLGDGTTITCGPGTAYDPSLSPGAQSSDCTHVFTRDSRRTADGAYQVRVTVTYAVSWDASTGAGGRLAELSRTTTVPVVVQEAQALVR